VIAVTTGCAKDILPVVRPGDMSRMTPKAVRLGDAQWMSDAAASDGFEDHGSARRVFAARSSGFMLPGHKWSADWLNVYSNWMADGLRP
jgi:hypothetical protein